MKKKYVKLSNKIFKLSYNKNVQLKFVKYQKLKLKKISC